MNSALQLEAGRRLQEALREAGLLVERDLTEGPKVTGQQEVDALSLVAAWTRWGWRVNLLDPTTALRETPPIRGERATSFGVLRLLKDESVAASS